MKYVTKAIVPCVVVALAAGCIWFSLYASSMRHEGPGRVHDARNGFSIVPPAGWTSREAAMGNFMAYTGPQEGEFVVNFNVNVRKVKSTATPEQMLPGAKRALAKLLTNYEVVEEAFEVIDGRRSSSLCGTYDMGQYKLQNIQYCIPAGRGKVYTITFAAPQDVFDKYRPRFERAAVSARMD